MISPTAPRFAAPDSQPSLATCPVPKDAIKKKDLNKLKRRVVIKEYRGLIVAQAWPKKRGRPTSPLQRAWVEKFTRVNKATKLAEPCAFSIAECLTPNSGWYYRDVLATAMYGKLINENGEPRLLTPTTSLSRNPTQPTVSNVMLLLLPNTQQWNNNDSWSISDPSKMFFRSAGLYLVMFKVSFSAGSATLREARIDIHRNGAAAEESRFRYHIPASGRYVTAVELFYFNAGDYLEIKAGFFGENAAAQLIRWQSLAITPEAIVP